jgi:hypothetical protein
MILRNQQLVNDRGLLEQRTSRSTHRGSYRPTSCSGPCDLTRRRGGVGEFGRIFGLPLAGGLLEVVGMRAEGFQNLGSPSVADRTNLRFEMKDHTYLHSFIAGLSHRDGALDWAGGRTGGHFQAAKGAESEVIRVLTHEAGGLQRKGPSRRS